MYAIRSYYDEAIVLQDDIRIKMIDIESGIQFEDGMLINTGVPHFVQFMDHIDNIDIKAEGRKKRWDNRFGPEGANINFIKENSAGNLNIV